MGSAAAMHTSLLRWASLLRIMSLAAFVGFLFAASGGKTLDATPPAPSGGGSGGAQGGSSGGGPGGGGGGGGGGGSGGGGSCVYIDPSTYDQSCQASSDCIDVTTGELCPGYCGCGGSTISKSEQARYDAAIAPLGPSKCLCPA